jgi:PAP2 superfamily protein
VRQFSGRREAAIGLGAYAVYLGVRALVVNERGRRRASENARRVCELEERLGLHVEPAIQQLLLPRRRLLRVLNVSYVTLNVALTVGWLMLLYRRRDPDFHRFRRAAALSLVGACPAFLLFPCDPPRALDGFVDTVSDVLDMDSGLVAQVYNPIAAMPSIHCAFAVVTGAAMARTARSPFMRDLGRVYPIAVFGTVLATANHYVLDGIAGSGLALLALRVSGKSAPPTALVSAPSTGRAR